MQERDFSVCICVYEKDNPKWFGEAVSSVLSQSCPPTEVILIVDGPVPEALRHQILDCARHEEVSVFWLPQNVGHGNARRAGLEKCTHDLVALMDADDLSVYDRFEKQLRLFDSDEDLAAVGGQIEEFVETPELPVGYRTVPLANDEIRKYMKKRCPMNQVTMMFRKSAVIAAGGYLDWYCNEDYYLWLRMYLAGMKFANVSDVLVHVRVGMDMYRRRGGWRYFQSEWKLQNYMLKNHVIGPVIYAANVAKRFVVQVLLPGRLRGWFFQRFARSKEIGQAEKV